MSQNMHQIEREYQIFISLENTTIPVPKTYALCVDESVLGSPFYIMEFVEGRIFENMCMHGVTSPQERTQLWREAIKLLVKIHSIEPVDAGLENLGKGSNFYDRQIRTLMKVSEKQKNIRDSETGETVCKLPHIEKCMQYLANKSSQPRERVSLVHGDFKLDNIIFHKTEPRVVGIIEYVQSILVYCVKWNSKRLTATSWELSTIGHPLSDLSHLLMPYCLAHDPALQPYDLSTFRPGHTEGQPTLEQMQLWYAEESGYKLGGDLKYGIAFNMFKSAIWCQGIAARIAMAQSKNKQAGRYAQMARPFAELAWKLTQNTSEESTARSACANIKIPDGFTARL